MADQMRKISLCVVGQSGAGKTTCIVRFVKGYFQDNLDPTVFDDYNFTAASHPKLQQNYAVKIKDTAGQVTNCS